MTILALNVVSSAGLKAFRISGIPGIIQIFLMSFYSTTLLLALVFGVLGAYLFTVEVPTTQLEAQKEKTEKRLLPFDYREVTQFTVRLPSEEIVMVRDHRHRWRTVEPFEAKADNREVGNLLRALELGRILRVIQEQASEPERYGLKPPYLTISLVAGEQFEAISLGDVGPTSSTLYAQRASDDKILLTTLSVKDFRKKSLYAFRRKKILSFNRTKAERLRIQSGANDFVLYRTLSDHGSSARWRFRSPIEGPADQTAVGLLLMAMEDLTAIGFIDSGSEREQLFKELITPLAALTLHTNGVDYKVSFFQPDPKSGEAFAVSSTEGPIYRVNPQFLQDLPTNIFDLQDKRLLGIEAGEIALLTVKTDKMKYALIQQHQTWVLENQPDKELDKQKVILFVSRLVNLPAELRVTDIKENLADYGLLSPTAEFTAIDTKGRKRGRLILGRRESGLVYAIGSGLPGVYQVRSAILTHIPAKQTLLVENE